MGEPGRRPSMGSHRVGHLLSCPALIRAVRNRPWTAAMVQKLGAPGIRYSLGRKKMIPTEDVDCDERNEI